ncbi:MAG TPA: lytic transglycosylase domain-containing protein [Sandaracinaceae bacterium LLY-WYZ-13_1]|nr:lytic transglycosylase domain-containing protein [Sandaracinaceae bacterium LLY-WYZ-13_1]
MQHRVFHIAAVFISLAGFAFPATGAAFDPEPVCAHPVTSDPGLLGPSFEDAMSIDPAPMCAPSEAPVAVPERLDDDDAREALARARRLAADGRHAAAVLALRVTAEAVPELADRLALEEAGYRMADGADALACEAYERATESDHRTVALRAQLGLARCRLSLADPEGVALFEDLRRRYPELPQAQELSLLLGAANERWGEREEAGRIYRRLDLMHPGSPHAATARARIARLRADGVDVRELRPTQQVDRAERLVRTGPMDAARAEIARLRSTELSRQLAQQVARSAARIARVEGRWEEASRLLREAQGLPDLEPEEREAMNARARDLARAAESREVENVRRRIASLTRRRPLRTQPTARIFAVLRMAARAGLTDVVDEALDAVRRRDRIPPGLRFDAAILGAGTGDDERVAALFASAREHPVYGTAARYHHARTLERLGRREAARREYLAVIGEDSERLPYYAMWARQRLRETAAPPAEPRDPTPVAALGAPTACSGDGPFTAAPLLAMSSGKGASLGRPVDTSCTPSAPANPFVEPAPADAEASGERTLERLEREERETLEARAHEAEQREGAAPPDVTLSTEEIVALLEPLAEAHGEAFPWIPRALRLVRLGETRAAGDELHEAYTAWRDANGRGSLRAGLMSVLRGGAPPRHRVSRSTWRARRLFPSDARRTLARVSAALGEHGLAIRFSGGFELTGPRPRAYADLVGAAAARHGIEPELLFAVMRVESVYNPRIISYAGAIGLAQIMPRTGRLIAQSLGRDDFTIDQLLEPEVNLEFAAWYLSSLIDRFDGRIPLAVASYNGGPHNVRRWMRDHAETMPLDAFLERIPFSQTHRYVRRVMTHYEAYKAQGGEALAAVDLTLPEPQPDPVAF